MSDFNLLENDPSIQALDAFFRESAPAEVARFLRDEMAKRQIKLASLYLGSEACCALGATAVITHLITHPDDRDLIDGDLLGIVSERWIADEEDHGDTIHMDAWLADQTLMSSAELAALEHGFEHGYYAPMVDTYDTTTPQASLDHFYAIGKELNRLRAEQNGNAYDEESNSVIWR